MKFVLTTIGKFIDDRCATLAAALAYYTIFALPPLMFLLLSFVTAGMTIAYENVEARNRARVLVQEQASQILGNAEAAQQITDLLDHRALHAGSWWASGLSIVGILIGATGVMAALQDSLNLIWDVKPEPGRTRLGPLFRKRVMSLAMILGLGFLLLVSLILSTALTTVGRKFTEVIGIHANTASWINQSVTLCIVFFFFAALFRFMPDTHVAWRDVWMGSLVTTALFSAGRGTLQWYLFHFDPAEALDSAAASLVVILVWVYYTSMILLYGAEFTHVWASQHGRATIAE
jgi:membrane protein